MNRNPVKWAAGSFAIHAIGPGFLWLLLESERPNEGLSRAMTFWPFTALLGYAPAVALFTYVFVRSTELIPTETASSELLVGAIVLLDLIAFALAWTLGQWGFPASFLVPALPLAWSAVLLLRGKTAQPVPGDRR